MANENMDKAGWKKVIEFVIEVLKLIAAGFLGGSATTLF